MIIDQFLKMPYCYFNYYYEYFLRSAVLVFRLHVMDVIYLKIITFSGGLDDKSIDCIVLTW